MSKYFFLVLIVTIFTIALVASQTPDCRPRIVLLRRGQRTCERVCPPRTPPNRCITANKDIRVSICPPRCCRAGNICVPIKRT